MLTIAKKQYNTAENEKKEKEKEREAESARHCTRHSFKSSRLKQQQQKIENFKSLL